MPRQRVHDRAILDALDEMDPIPFSGAVWRITGFGRDPLRGSGAIGRWSPASDTEVLYTSLEKEGAFAEIGFRLSLEPVWPSRLRHQIHELTVQRDRSLHFADISSLDHLGVDSARYESFDYDATVAIAAAAHFLEYDGLLVPSARYPCQNLVLFLDRGPSGSLELKNSEEVDWAAWRDQSRHD
jgi:RES domain-containing protein